MKNRKQSNLNVPVLLLIVVIISLTSCNKDDDAGNILVKVKCQNQEVEQAMVYIKYKTNCNPNIPLNNYDKSVKADAAGEAYFENLAPSDYFFYATGYSRVLKKNVSGEQSIKVISKFRNNEQIVCIETK